MEGGDKVGEWRNYRAGVLNTVETYAASHLRGEAHYLNDQILDGRFWRSYDEGGVARREEGQYARGEKDCSWHRGPDEGGEPYVVEIWDRGRLLVTWSSGDPLYTKVDRETGKVLERCKSWWGAPVFEWERD
jgi:hypothetical protein